MADDASTRVPFRVQCAVYGAGLFSNSSLHLYNTIVPLWVGLVTRDPFIVGIVLGARHLLPLLFSIHGGALMDRFGARRVLLILAAVSLVLPLLYPVLPFVTAMIVLQALSGYAVMTSWVGVQSMIGHAMAGRPVYAGRLTIATRIGMLAGPPAVGWAWDAGGAWGAFGMTALWAAGTLLCTAALPATLGKSGEEAAPDTAPARTGWRDLLPRWSDYRDAFALLAIPAIATVVAVTMVRHAGVTLQGSFYVYYLGEVGISGKWIGFLFSCTGICGIVGLMCVGQVSKRFAPRPLLLTVIAITILSVAVTPLLYRSGFVIELAVLEDLLRPLGIAMDLTAIAPFLGFYILLMAAQGIRGFSGAFAQAMEIAMVAQSAGARAQGKGAALRLTAGRLSAFVLPVAMGAFAKLVGLENAFYVVGGLILLVLAWLATRAPKTAPVGEAG